MEREGQHDHRLAPYSARRTDIIAAENRGGTRRSHNFGAWWKRTELNFMSLKIWRVLPDLHPRSLLLSSSELPACSGGSGSVREGARVSCTISEVMLQPPASSD